MEALKKTIIALRDDEEGAAFLEYTVLLGIILAVSIAVIFAMGTWAGSIWGVLCNQIQASNISGDTVPGAGVC
jgi:pilus assembly protein Flp/PilA